MKNDPLKFSIKRDLGLQILALYMLFMIPIVTSALIFNNFAGQRLKEEIQSADLALARAIAQETNTIIQNSLITVEKLAAYKSVISADENSMLDLFEKVQSARSDVNLIYRLGPDGIMLFHYPVEPLSTVGVDFSFRGYFQRALESKEALISLGRISPTTEQPVATAVMPLWQDGEFLGVVATNMKLQSFSTTLASIVAEYQQGDGFQVMIIDSGGKVIAYPDSEFLLTDLLEILPTVSETVLNNESGNLIATPVDGEESLYSFVPVQSAGWGVIVSRPISIAYATPTSFQNGVYIMIAVFLAIGLFFWIALSTRVLRPLERLTTFSQAVGANKQISQSELESLLKFSKRPDQIGHLIRSFTRMEEAIRARINELSTLLETSAAVVSSLDHHTVLNRILEQVERLLDLEKSAIVAFDESRNVFSAHATRGLSREYAEQLEISPDESSSLTLRAMNTGEPIFIQDIETASSFSPNRARAREEGYRSFAAIPLKTIHTPPAALVLYGLEPQVFHEREVNLLSSFANQAAMAIENATLYSRSDMRLQEQTRRLEALIQSLEVGLILEDLKGNVLYINRSIHELVYPACNEVAGKPVTSLFKKILAADTEKDKTLEALEKVLSGKSQGELSFSLELETGLRYFRLTGFSVTDSEGLLIGRGQIIQDITKDYELDKMKSSLISTASHELRTPLAAIKGYVTTLLADDVDWEIDAQNEFLEIISMETDRLSDLVSNLLDMSRIEAGDLTLSRTACDLKVLTDRGVKRAYPNPGDRLIIEFPEKLPQVYVDSQRIEVVMRNLVENAAKYAENNLPIRISAEINNGQIIVRVDDQGPGIPNEMRNAVFESFYRLENGLTKRKPGVGLGLAICRGFVDAHGGEIWIEPKEEGTCVAFSLPAVDLNRLISEME